jgi:hypothetical protein
MTIKKRERGRNECASKEKMMLIARREWKASTTTTMEIIEQRSRRKGRGGREEKRMSGAERPKRNCTCPGVNSVLFGQLLTTYAPY